MRVLRSIPLGMLGILLAALIILPACREDTDVAEERDAVPDVTPVALEELPESVEVVSIVIDGGAFDTDEIVLQMGEPTVLRIANEDDERYAFTIGDLLTPTELAPGEVTDIELTTPVSDEYVGELLTEDEEEVVDTVPVLVIAPGRTGP